MPSALRFFFGTLGDFVFPWSWRHGMEHSQAGLSGQVEQAPELAQPSVMTAMRSRQSERLKQLRGALFVSGLGCLDQQAEALGLSRSTAWFVLHGTHKSSGLSPVVLLR